jgi:hypothetical protein
MAANCFVERPRTSTDPFYFEFDKARSTPFVFFLHVFSLSGSCYTVFK